MPGDKRIGDASCFNLLHYFKCTRGVEVFEDDCKFVRRNPMNGTPRCIKLHIVSMGRCKMNLGPVDQFLVDMPRDDR